MRLAPVFYTLAQVQFNPIKNMSDYVPKLQDRLRRNGFPDFREEHQIGLSIRRLDESPPDIQTQPQVSWIFTNARRTEGYSLALNSLTFSTTNYDTFKDFLEKTITGLDMVHDIIGLSYTDRIGLRYLDSIVAEENDNLQQYLNPSLLGFSENLEGELVHIFTQTLSKVEGGSLVAKSFMSTGTLPLPPDLISAPLEIQPRFTSIDGQNLVLDMDYFTDNRVDFDLANAREKITIAHNIIKKAFEASVTPYALQKWE
jgi:uncharacterized protein (TIGR04255 family)